MTSLQIFAENASTVSYLTAVVCFGFAAVLFFRLQIADAWRAVAAARRARPGRRAGKRLEKNAFIIRERKLVVHTEERLL